MARSANTWGRRSVKKPSLTSRSKPVTNQSQRCAELPSHITWRQAKLRKSRNIAKPHERSQANGLRARSSRLGVGIASHKKPTKARRFPRLPQSELSAVSQQEKRTSQRPISTRFASGLRLIRPQPRARITTSTRNSTLTKCSRANEKG